MQRLLIFVCAFPFLNAGCVEALQSSPNQEYHEPVERLFSGTWRSKRDVVMVPEIMSNISWDGSDVVSPGGVLTYNVSVTRAISSTSDVFNIRLQWLFPENLKFQTLNQTVGPELNTQVYSSYVNLQVQHLERSNEIRCSLTFVFDPGMSADTGRHFITTHTQLSWEDRPVSGTRYTNRWETFSNIVEFPGCSSQLGVGSGYVRDHQMTSSSHITGHEPFKARLNNSQGWCASVLDDAQFLQIDFVYQVTVTKLSVQGLSSRVGVEQFILQFSFDFKNWKNYTEYGATRVFNCSRSNNSVHWLVQSVKTYNVRLVPVSWYNSICLKIEVFGCEHLATPASCILPLGMESGFITDEALSTSLDLGNPYDSRLGKKVKGHGGWLASPFVDEDYLQIDLAVLYSVTKVGVEGQWSRSGLLNSFVKKYTIKMSNDSFVWQNYTENGRLKVFDGPTSSSAALHPTFVKLAEPVVTRYIRIFPQAHTIFRVMRLEVYGCLKEPMPHPVPDDFSRRSYLLNNITGDFYVCLYKDDTRTESSCQYTRDGYVWNELNERIVKILAVDFHHNVIYVLERSNCYLRSSDDGWLVISSQQWKRVKTSPEVILAREVPENLLRKGPDVGGEILESSNGYQWSVSHTGVHSKRPGEDWAVVASWKCNQ